MNPEDETSVEILFLCILSFVMKPQTKMRLFATNNFLETSEDGTFVTQSLLKHKIVCRELDASGSFPSISIYPGDFKKDHFKHEISLGIEEKSVCVVRFFRAKGCIGYGLAKGEPEKIYRDVPICRGNISFSWREKN
ncbi:hypothetical protein CEXT_496441 [Caerostris extrusa]|uniref:Uncharacterized protein n=1 Tax=Caerostris extrusa TaxID=172846 RepID=A0AAV4TRS4_CAEEX|nr:hypothetical protein CEXT_496441 [Caerostris extrusa]